MKMIACINELNINTKFFLESHVFFVISLISINKDKQKSMNVELLILKLIVMEMETKRIYHVHR